MSTDPDSPRVLARLRSEIDAQFLVDHLASLGIKAMLSGSPLMTAQPEVPATIDVIVRQADVERAQVAREKLAQTNPRVR